ncbi:hypothetical protein PG1C_07045 [Rugosibacter aromaticivorans]|uniref:Uncharacterized protein n=1 Tax=Rugosibacter aromaticivorans TaxID=1565605 RepID=A0A0C5JLM0_9PROT|nr:hypothetical protein [Rugosibacter aromaticivorans]AJP48286.1 hypothetical protein PG1C_07045 [Rugosibacter aromaticivorans]TBR15104.1 MAG: hypothetical protein EPO43_05095 [Rugosibacter sp.]
MNLLTHIVAAEEDEVVAIGESLRPTDEWSGIERRGIDTAKIVMLHTLLTNDDFDLACALYEPLYIGSEGAVVLKLANSVTEKLAMLDEEALAQVAEELAATAEFEMEGWPEDDIQSMIMDLADLAQLASAQEQALFVWMHPLFT